MNTTHSTQSKAPGSSATPGSPQSSCAPEASPPPAKLRRDVCVMTDVQVDANTEIDMSHWKASPLRRNDPAAVGWPAASLDPRSAAEPAVFDPGSQVPPAGEERPPEQLTEAGLKHRAEMMLFSVAGAVVSSGLPPVAKAPTNRLVVLARDVLEQLISNRREELPPSGTAKGKLDWEEGGAYLVSDALGIGLISGVDARKFGEAVRYRASAAKVKLKRGAPGARAAARKTALPAGACGPVMCADSAVAAACEAVFAAPLVLELPVAMASKPPQPRRPLCRQERVEAWASRWQLDQRELDYYVKERARCGWPRRGMWRHPDPPSFRCHCSQMAEET
jgi:hypothetical protein